MITINYPGGGSVGFDFSATNTERMTPAQAFELAEQICRAAAQAIPEPEEGESKETEGWFGNLYLAIDRVGSDWHREAKRRAAGEERGQWSKKLLTPDGARDAAGEQALETVRDWDY